MESFREEITVKRRECKKVQTKVDRQNKRAINEEDFKKGRAAEKAKERDVKRKKDQDGFNKERATKLAKEREKKENT